MSNEFSSIPAWVLTTRFWDSATMEVRRGLQELFEKNQRLGERLVNYFSDMGVVYIESIRSETTHLVDCVLIRREDNRYLPLNVSMW